MARITGSFDPARNGAAIVPSNTVDLDPRPKALWVNEECTLVLMGENAATFSIVCGGPGAVPFSPRRVMATSTASAGAIIGAYD